jgi:hypothetical protein
MSTITSVDAPELDGVALVAVPDVTAAPLYVTAAGNMNTTR